MLLKLYRVDKQLTICRIDEIVAVSLDVVPQPATRAFVLDKTI